MARRWNLLYLVVLICGVTSVHADDALEPGPVLDPYYGQALFDFYQGEYFDSIVDILAADERGRLPNHAEDAELLLGGLYLSYGLHDTAAEIFERLLATKTRPEVRDRTWFFLAKIRYQRGYFERALEALQAIERPLIKSLRPEKRMMQAQTLMALGRYDEAAILLERWRGPGEWHHFASYNLGVAYIRAGNLQQGANILEDITAKRGVDREEFQSLQDKANVALGYSYLQNEQPELAKKALQRVRLNGPFSNKALLGVGWADAAMENYGKALVPWLELRGRDLLDSAVQESLLAIPFAYGKLSANNEAAQQYLLAINAYVEETARLNEAIARIEDGTVVTGMLADELDKDLGWYWQLDSVPDSYESRYLYHLLAGHAFQEALKNFRDLAALQKNLRVWQENVEVFDHMLGTRKQAFEARLPGALALMESADLNALAAQSDALRAEVQSIEDNADLVALAPEKEAELWREIVQLEKTPGLDQDWPEAQAAREKIRLLKGVLTWQMEKSFPARVWQLKNNLRDLDRTLAHSEDLKQKAAQALRDEPDVLAEFGERVAAISPRIEIMLQRLSDLLALQQAEVNRIAVSELKARKARLETYTVQARFALASIYDKASEGGTQP